MLGRAAEVRAQADQDEDVRPARTEVIAGVVRLLLLGGIRIAYRVVLRDNRVQGLAGATQDPHRLALPCLRQHRARLELGNVDLYRGADGACPLAGLPRGSEGPGSAQSTHTTDHRDGTGKETTPPRINHVCTHLGTIPPFLFGGQAQFPESRRLALPESGRGARSILQAPDLVKVARCGPPGHRPETRERRPRVEFRRPEARKARGPGPPGKAAPSRGASLQPGTRRISAPSLVSFSSMLS